MDGNFQDFSEIDTDRKKTLNSYELRSKKNLQFEHINIDLLNKEIR